IFIWLGKNEQTKLASPDDIVLPSIGGALLAIPLLLAAMHIFNLLIKASSCFTPRLSTTNDSQFDSNNSGLESEYADVAVARSIRNLNTDNTELAYDEVALIDDSEDKGKEKEDPSFNKSNDDGNTSQNGHSKARDSSSLLHIQGYFARPL